MAAIHYAGLQSYVTLLGRDKAAKWRYVVNAALSRFSTATATEHGCCLIPQCPWIANFLERHCYRAWLSSDEGDVCSALSRDLVLSTCCVTVKMQMPTFAGALREARVDKRARPAHSMPPQVLAKIAQAATSGQDV